MRYLLKNKTGRLIKCAQVSKSVSKSVSNMLMEVIACKMTYFQPKIIEL